PLVEEFIPNTLIGIEYLWGGPVQLETSEVESVTPKKGNGQAGIPSASQEEQPEEHEVTWRKVLYTMKDRKLTKKPV
ncbi:MAG: SpoVR family protein, partial [Deltaproteobacteria bacterium]|nr:SpoVR family protein [Deltaproteobacteria bacterium]